MTIELKEKKKKKKKRREENKVHTYFVQYVILEERGSKGSLQYNSVIYTFTLCVDHVMLRPSMRNCEREH